MRLVSLRLLLAAGFLLFALATFALARRLAPPAAALLVTLAALAWSVPNYFASLPSWYNLFLAAGAAYALVRHMETGRRGWLFVSGVAVGVSVAVKVVGLYLVPAILLYLAFLEQEASARGGRSPVRHRALLLAAEVLAGGGLLALMAALFVRPPFATRRAVHFLLPAAALVAFLLVSEWRRGGGRSADRLLSYARLAFPFLLGILLVLALIVAPYAATGSLEALWRGLFVIPARQIRTAVAALPGLEWLGAAALLGLFFAVPPRSRGASALAAVVCAAAGLGLLFASGFGGPYRALWSIVRGAGVALPIAAAAALLRNPKMEPRRRLALFLFAALFAFTALVQFPFSSPIYFCYAAPLLFLTAAAFPLPRGIARTAAASLAAFLFLFALFRMQPGYVFQLGRHPGAYEAEGVLPGPRGGLRVPAADARTYGALLQLLQKTPGTLWSGPDAPEVYFLSARPNPTRHFFEHVSDDYGDAEALFLLLDAGRIETVVVHRAPHFSAPLSEDLVAELARRYPHRYDVGRFSVLSKVRLGELRPIIPAP